ncbi:MAG TPA: hypothetical protein VK927_03835, partial [Adhaeribacter sp.]|nr:hypothetical protein [Adhaeribacter sp.]
FSVVVATKVQNYVFVVGPLIFLSLGALLCFLEHLLQHRLQLRKVGRLLFLALLLLVGWFTLNYGRIRHNHFTGNYYGMNNYRGAREYNKKVYQQLPGMFWGQQHVVFNLRPLEHIDLMFYTNLTGYDRVPSREDLELLKMKGLKIAVFDDVALPDYVKADSTIYKIPVKLL